MWKWIKNNAVLVGMIVLGILIFFRDVLFSLVLGSARKTVRETREKAREHKEAADKAKAASDSHKAESDKLEDEIANIKVDEDWHKKRED